MFLPCAAAVASHASAKRSASAPCGVDDVERVDGVALDLRHLLAVLVGDHRVQVDRPERHLLHEVQPRHHHPRDPEEDDVVPGLEQRRRVEGLELAGLVGPAQRRERPQPRREPGVEHVLVLGQLGGAALAARRRRRPRHRDLAALAAGPRRDAVPPPQLPRDAPVADVVHPVEKRLRPRLGNELGLPLLHRLDRRLGERLHLDEPLRRQHRLDDRVAALAVTDRVDVRLAAALEPQLLQLGLDRLARREPVQAGERAPLGIHHARVIEDRDHRQLVPLAGLEVVRIVRRRHLDRAGAELRIDQDRVGDDRELALQQRMPHHLADLRLVARIVGVDGDRRVAQHRLRPRRRHHHLARAVRQRVRELVQLALRPLVVVDLEVRQRRSTRRAPVDQAARAIDQPLFVEANERLDDRRRVRRIHREARAVPVQRAAEALELLEDPVAGAVAPLPDPLDERGAADVVAALLLLLAQLALDDHLRGDAGVVGAGQPHGVVGGHPPPAGEDVLDGVAERVPHVQRAGDVRRRDDHGERRLGCGRVRVEVAARHPLRVPARLDLLRVVVFGSLRHLADVI